MTNTFEAASEAAESGAAMSDFTAITAGTLPTGTETAFGSIEQTSYTAYLIGGEWVPFHKIHGRPAPVMPLVVFA